MGSSHGGVAHRAGWENRPGRHERKRAPPEFFWGWGGQRRRAVPRRADFGASALCAAPRVERCARRRRLRRAPVAQNQKNSGGELLCSWRPGRFLSSVRSSPSYERRRLGWG